MTSIPDKLLLEARNHSIQVEQVAIRDLRRNIGRYLQPNWQSRRMIDDWGTYVTTNGMTTYDGYINLRNSFTETKGKSHKVFSDVLASHIRKTTYDMSQTMFGDYHESTDRCGAAGTMTQGQNGTSVEWRQVIDSAVRRLEAHGWWKSRCLAPESLVKSLKAKFDQQLTIEYGDKVRAIYEGHEGAPVQLRVHSGAASTFEELYQLSADPLLLSIVHDYLGVPPIFNTPVALFNSAVSIRKEIDLSNAAQMYHHDMNRLGFVKLFIYLTDVDDDSGPHTLVRGTHRQRPDPLWADGRHSDEAVAAHGLDKDEVRITGKAGTFFLVDTSCLHKGTPPLKNARLMAQVQYANSLFGKPISPSDRRIELAARNKKEWLQQAAEIVRKYALRSGVRFVQNYI